MKRTLLLVISMLMPWLLMGQGRGIGYSLDMGGSLWNQSVNDYDQVIGSITHNGFIRKHNEAGTRALQLMVGYKTENVAFRNTSTFMAPTGNNLLSYNTDAHLERTAWKFAMIEQFQFVGKPGGLVISINPGLFYERTVSANRYSDYDGISYSLVNEIRPHNIGYTFGFEARLLFITFGYKVERMFQDVLDHEYILSQDLSMSNSTELRGLYMNPLMHYFYMGVNLDFYRNRKKD